MPHQTSEGYSWTRESGLRVGNFACEGVVVPREHLDQPSDCLYDAVVIGAGYAGLIAARDLSNNAHAKVLLLEARDRIGGRTWTASAFGENLEMGGTWLHW